MAVQTPVHFPVLIAPSSALKQLTGGVNAFRCATQRRERRLQQTTKRRRVADVLLTPPVYRETRRTRAVLNTHTHTRIFFTTTTTTIIHTNARTCNAPKKKNINLLIEPNRNVLTAAEYLRVFIMSESGGESVYPRVAAAASCPPTRSHHVQPLKACQSRGQTL